MLVLFGPKVGQICKQLTKFRRGALVVCNVKAFGVSDSGKIGGFFSDCSHGSGAICTILWNQYQNRVICILQYCNWLLTCNEYLRFKNVVLFLLFFLYLCNFWSCLQTYDQPYIRILIIWLHIQDISITNTYHNYPLPSKYILSSISIFPFLWPIFYLHQCSSTWEMQHDQNYKNPRLDRDQRLALFQKRCRISKHTF